MAKTDAEKILKESYINSINECLFVLNAIRDCFDPVPDCINETIDIVNWIYDKEYKEIFS